MASAGRWVCTVCGGAYTIDGSRGDGGVVLRCSSCGAEVRATLTIETPPAEAIGPLSKRSASAMLDETPPSRAPLRLSLISEQPILPPPKSVPPVTAATAEREIEPTPLSSSALVEAPPSSRGVEEISSDELVEAPPSARDGALAARAATPNAPHVELAEEDDQEEDDGESVSLKDMLVVAKLPTPMPPKAGTLKTLPPSALSAPPPTIEVPPASARKKSATPTAPEPAGAKAAARPAPAEESEGRSSLVWIGGAAVVGLVVWLGMRSSTPTPTAAAPTAEPTASPLTSAVSGATAAPATGSATAPPPASASGSARVVDVPATELVSGSAGAKPAGDPGASGGGGRSTSELLDRAAKARHAGDLAKASALYTRVLEAHPGDVEASSGLGELSRMSGDLPAAKRHFQDALQSSPSFSPALLGLGDTLWELGEKHESAQVYARLVGVRDNVPERARERSMAGGAAKAPVPTVTALPASALPPSPPPPPSLAPEEGNN